MIYKGQTKSGKKSSNLPSCIPATLRRVFIFLGIATIFNSFCSCVFPKTTCGNQKGFGHKKNHVVWSLSFCQTQRLDDKRIQTLI